MAIGALVVVSGCTSSAPRAVSPSRAPTTSTSAGFRFTTLSVEAAVDDVHLAPPPAGVRPRITGRAALAAARHGGGRPDAGRPTVIALTSYTNTAQGTIVAGSGVRLAFVHRLSWAIIDAGQTCRVFTGVSPAASGPHRVTARHDCVDVVFVDAQTGKYLGGLGSIPASADVSTALAAWTGR